jgi:hypothetical protein
VIRNGDWFGFGDRLAAGQDPLRFFEMRLHRIGDTGWPPRDAVPPK